MSIFLLRKLGKNGKPSYVCAGVGDGRMARSPPFLRSARRLRTEQGRQRGAEGGWARAWPGELPVPARTSLIIIAIFIFVKQGIT